MSNDANLQAELMQELCTILARHTVNTKLANKTLYYDGIFYSIKMARRSYNDTWLTRCVNLRTFRLENQPNWLKPP